MNNYNIPGTNGLFQINENRELSKTRGLNKDVLFSKREHYVVTLYEHRKRVSADWLYWLARFNLELTKPYQQHIFNFRFARKNPKYDNHNVNNTPTAVYFERPVYTDITNEARLVPRFPKYAIKQCGTLQYLPTQHWYNVTPARRTGTAGYPTQAIRGSNGTQLVHVLVASAWVDNPDWCNNLIVDHIDGDKTNCNSSNLRWTDFTGNNSAKIDQGLSKQAIAVRVRNMVTNEVSEYPSIRRACEAIGRSAIDPVNDPLAKGRVWITSTGKYEILPVVGFTEWSYLDSKPTMTRNQKVTITITHPDRTSIVLTSLEDFTNKVFGGKRSADRIETAIDITRNRYPDSRVEVVRYDVKTSYMAMNMKTGKEHIRETRTELSKLTKIPKSSIGKSIRANGCVSYSGWTFKENDGYEWSDDIQKSRETCIEVLDNLGKVKKFNSLRQAATYVGVDRKTLVKASRMCTLLKDRYLIHVM
ncbi:MAG: NUMOD1 domain-containing DNA-binding protein [Mariprofundaceae bacterium]|nr:NUMOD1 domain-containing DNA-binding protein [Mariprofundaceae bacterium]